MNNTLKILVTGATGQQGGAVARALLKRGHTVYALTRRPDSVNAVFLKNKGAEIIKGDFTHIDDLPEFPRDLDGIFIMTTPYETGPGDELLQGENSIDAAESVGVKHIIFTSVANADKNTGIPHFDSKFEVEKYLATIETPYTIVAPAFFYDNFTSPFLLPGLKTGRFFQALPPDVPLQSVSVETIGEFTAHVFENRELFMNKRIDLAEDELNGVQYSRILSETSNSSIQYTEIPIDEVRRNSEDLALMYEWFNTVGYSVDIKDLQGKFPGIPWQDFKTWARKQDWKHLLHDAHLSKTA
jgi:uncharacterized protein YbjT (DUF2867 family)